jgi:hypothetical protein
MTTMKTYDVEIHGLVPMLMHNGQLSDPFNYYTKELKKLTSKRTKTEEDQLKMMRVEWDGGLYLNERGEVAVPADNILAMIKAGAKKFKLGKQVDPAVFATEDFYEFTHEGPKDIDKLYADPQFVFRKRVKVGQSAVIRTRPRFPKWSCKFKVDVVPDIMNPDDLKRIVETAGRIVGLGEWNPRFGRFNVTKFKAV